MNLEPSQAAGGQRLRLVEQEQATTEIVADVAQVGWDGVRTSAEIEVVGQVEGVAEELHAHVRLFASPHSGS